MASTTSIDVCTNFPYFVGSVWGLVEAFTAINAREKFGRFPVRSRTVLLAKSRVGLQHRLVSWCERLRSHANRASDIGVVGYMVITRRLRDTGNYQDIG